ncbi:hypothetical protein QLQ12_28175 [Actinoplanes sp. NEAU-A12]|uniref:Gram-positive cocci surface proteins LPxTG domain-containing protein n=1 Tax=Actinoplanes sandaracinus TaxID=3045177 RepID=A0ABT6WRY7_9ACTN|nr:hypothetical protein [Actinoplanes sandaracinus]MDI6102504.1 hypothetical protein [Actinoplanes sandaracinus]
MPITRRFAPLPRCSPLRSRAVTAGVVSLVAALAIPAVPATASPGSPAARDCAAGDFTARAQADLAKITLLDPGPLATGLPTLADVRLASAKGSVDSAARPYKSIAAGRHADARVLGLPAGGAAARHAAPSRGGPDVRDLVTFQAAGLATADVGRSTAHALWDDGYRCAKTGPLTRSATMLSGLSVLGGDTPAMRAGALRTSLLRMGPTGSARSATDLVPLGNGRTGVRSHAGADLGDLSLFAGTPQEISVKIVSQPELEVVAGGDRARSKVTYRPAVLRVTTAGRPADLLEHAGAVVSLGVLGGVDRGSPVALEVRLSLGEVRQSGGGRQVQAEAATVRVEVKVGMAHLLDVTLGDLSVAACAPAPVRGDKPRPRDGGSLLPPPVGVAQPAGSPAPGDSPPAASAPEPAGPAEPSGGTSGDLALTGADVSIFGFAGAGLVLAGLISLLLTRRPARG